MDAKNKMQTTSGFNIAAGLWLLLSPYILGFAAITVALVNNILLGIVIGVLALFRVYKPEKTSWLSVVNAILGLWLIISPFALSFGSAAPIWNNVILGIIVVVMAVWSANIGFQEMRKHA